MKEFNGIILSDLSTIGSIKKENEFKRLVGTINLLQDEDYDCTLENVWSYSKGTDIRDGINIKLGNMVLGYPFKIGEVTFKHSEGAYISVLYSSNTEDCKKIQKLLSVDGNGFLCKRIYRKSSEYERLRRPDFSHFNVEWMKFVILNKTKNEDFNKLLRRIPVDAHIVENTSKMPTRKDNDTSLFWGSKNQELKRFRNEIEKRIDEEGKRGKAMKKNLSTNAINNVGHFNQGKNVMGKILKLMSLSLIYQQNFPLDYSLLEDSKLFLIGEPIRFQ